MTNVEFVQRVLEIADTNPTYRTGGDGSDGTCDCIGLIMGALGGKFDMHSTNWFCRYELAIDPQQITEETEVELGDIVIKARNVTNPRYDLHERYQPGGRYFVGDLLDYYHVGVVTKAEPLEITHCTETGLISGIARDYALEGWTHMGIVEDLEYPVAEIPGDVPVPDLAVVYSEDREPVRMRSAPATDAGYNTIVKVPFGAEVVVLGSTKDWATITWNGQRGYMQKKFLRVIGMAEPPDNGNEKPMSFEAKVLAKLDEILFLIKGGEG